MFPLVQRDSATAVRTIMPMVPKSVRSLLRAPFQDPHLTTPLLEMVPVVLPLSADEGLDLCWSDSEPSDADVEAAMKVCSLPEVFFAYNGVAPAQFCSVISCHQSVNRIS